MNSKSVKEGGKHNMYSKSKRFIASFLAVLMAVCMLPADMFGGVGVAYAAALSAPTAKVMNGTDDVTADIGTGVAASSTVILDYAAADADSTTDASIRYAIGTDTVTAPTSSSEGTEYTTGIALADYAGQTVYIKAVTISADSVVSATSTDLTVVVNTATPPNTDPVADPVITVKKADNSSATDAEISAGVDKDCTVVISAGNDESIRYNIGTETVAEPTATTGTEYTDEIALTQYAGNTVTIKAIAYKTADTSKVSGVKTAEITVKTAVTVAKPTAKIMNGTTEVTDTAAGVDAACTVELLKDADATSIRYNIGKKADNVTAPAAADAGIAYTTAIPLAAYAGETVVIKAVAVKTEGSNSTLSAPFELELNVNADDDPDDGTITITNILNADTIFANEEFTSSAKITEAVQVASYFTIGTDNSIATIAETDSKYDWQDTISEIGGTGKTTYAVRLTAGGVQKGGGRAIKFTTTSANAELVVYAALKPDKTGREFMVMKTDSVAANKISGVQGTIAGGKVVKFTATLATAGDYYVGFSGDGGIVPYMQVKETKVLPETPDKPRATLETNSILNENGTNTIKLISDDPKAQIYYTIGAVEADVKDPKTATEAEGKTLYTKNSDITIDATHRVIKAYATKNGKDGDVETFVYKLRVAIPQAKHTAVVLGDNDKIELESSAGASIYYTTNGTSPSASSTLYENGGFTVSETKTINAIATKTGEGWVDSDVATFVYVVPSDAKVEKTADIPDDTTDYNLDGYFKLENKVEIKAITSVKDTYTNLSWDDVDIAAHTNAIILGGGSLALDAAPANCVTFTTSANDTEVVVYYSPKAAGEAKLTVASWDNTGKVAAEPVYTSAEAGNAKVYKEVINLTAAGRYCIGFTGGKTGSSGVGGGVIPYIKVSENPGGGSTEPTSVAAPVFVPALTAGKHTFGSKTGDVTITCATTGAKIYYVTNKGTNALTDAELEAVTEANILDNEKKQEYGTAISVTESGTKFKAIAVYTKSDSTEIKSTMISAEYDITENGYDVTANPTADPASGTINVNDTISLSADTGASIRYTTDGTTDPSATSGELYGENNKPTATAAGPFTVKAIAYKTETAGDTETVTAISSVVTFNYTVTETSGTVTLTSVTLDGEAKVGSTLTATPVFTGGTQDADKVAYAWYHVGSTDPISGANAATYVVKKADVGYKIKVVVTYDGDPNSAKEAETTTTVTEDNGGNGGDEDIPETGLAIKFDDGKTYIYTGAKITPSITVYNNGTPLVEGTDYTVKYTNNVNASHKVENDALTATQTNEKKLPTVTVTGKGSLSKKVTANFNIIPKALDNDDYESAANADTVAKVSAGASAVETKKATPVLLYGGAKLAVKKNFEYDDTTPANTTDWDGEKKLKLNGVNNFTGSVEITVNVIAKADQANAKIKADFKNGDVTGKDAVKNLYYNGTPYVIGFDVSTKGGLTNAADATDPLVEDTDYVISYPEDLTNVGAKKVTITGISSRCTGSVTKTYKVIPANKNGGEFKVDGVDTVNGYDYVSTGVTFDLTGENAVTVKYVTKSSDSTDTQAVSADGESLVPGKDFKISYSNNKKVGTAKYTVTGLGNYKGVVLKNQEFTINGISLTNQNDNLDVTVADVFYNKKGAYKSTPYVTVNGSLLKASEYVAYYTLAGEDESVPGKTRKIEDTDFAEGVDSITVTVTIKKKGKNVVEPDSTKSESEKTATFNIIKKTDGYDKNKDFSKAKITFFGGETKNKVGYTGKSVYPTSMVVKLGSAEETVALDATGQPADKTTYKYTIVYADNVAKGKATAVVTADEGSDYVGGKAGTFNIVPKALDSLDTANGEGFIASFMRGLFNK